MDVGDMYDPDQADALRAEKVAAQLKKGVKKSYEPDPKPVSTKKKGKK